MVGEINLKRSIHETNNLMVLRTVQTDSNRFGEREERKEEFGGNYEMEYNQIREEKEDIRYE